MSKAEVIDALMRSAVMVFARDGFEGASLREIAQGGGVALSTINLYFGGKLDLFKGVAAAAWSEVARERLERLAAVQARHGRAAAPLEELLDAFARPIVRRALGDEHERAKLNLLVSHISMLGLNGDRADRAVETWIEAIAPACPGLTHGELIWAFSYCTSTVYSWQLMHHRYDRMLKGEAARGVDEVTGEVVRFCCGGVRALIAARAAP